jgi:hypothetical protein
MLLTPSQGKLLFHCNKKKMLCFLLYLGSLCPRSFQSVSRLIHHIFHITKIAVRDDKNCALIHIRSTSDIHVWSTAAFNIWADSNNFHHSLVVYIIIIVAMCLIGTYTVCNSTAPRFKNDTFVDYSYNCIRINYDYK